MKVVEGPGERRKGAIQPAQGPKVTAEALIPSNAVKGSDRGGEEARELSKPES